MKIDELQQFRPVQYSIPKTLAVAVGVPLALFVGMVALSYPQTAGVLALSGLAVMVGHRLPSWLGRVRSRVGSGSGHVTTEEDGSFSTAPR